MFDRVELEGKVNGQNALQMLNKISCIKTQKYTISNIPFVLSVLLVVAHYLHIELSIVYCK